MGKGNDPRYTPTTCFETFPFPKGLTPADTRPKTEEESRSLGYIPLIGTVGNNGDKIEPIVPFSRAVPAIIADASQRIHAEKIAEAAFKLNQLRESWLNPPEWVEWVITPEEAKAGYPKRPVSKPGQEKELHKRTLTNLYNQRPSWLTNAHKNLDKAVAAAYGWNDYTSEMPDDVILSRLLALNKEIPTAEKKK
jgi:type II restriction/modification system DNA methylase subunit YeeA